VTEPKRAPKVNLKAGELPTKAKKDRSYVGVAPLEDLLETEPKGKTEMKNRALRAKFLSEHVDLGSYNRRCYLDLGARTFSSSILWFKNHYPRFQEGNFSITAFEADPSFSAEYEKHPEVNYHNNAAWVRNETLTFSGFMGHVDHDANPNAKKAKDRRSKQRAFSVQAVDMADFLMRTYTVDDFVVLKMDIEGAEYEVVPKILQTGAVELIDEMFLEGHTVKLNKIGGITKGHVYSEVVALLQALRDNGVYAHEWF